MREHEGRPDAGRFMRAARRGGRLVVIYAALILLFVTTMWIAYRLPEDRIQENVRASITLLEAEGLRPYVMLQHRAWRLDNYTEAQILDVSLRTEPGGTLLNSMANYKQVGPPSSAGWSQDNIAALKVSATGERDRVFSYARYWNGHQIFVRPALQLLSLSGIRWVNMILMSTLFLGVLLLFARRAGSRAGMALGLAAAWCGFLIVPMSIDFSNVMYVTLWAMLFLLVKAESDWFDRHAVEFFFVVGMLTSFFDLATAPTTSLGMPLALALVLAARQPREHPFKSGLLLTVQAGVAWAVGYVASWVTKWFLAAAVTGNDVVGDALSQLLFRTGSQESAPRALEGVTRNLSVEAVMRNLSDLVPLVRPGSVLPTALFLGLLVLITMGFLLAFRVPYSRIRQVLPVLLVVPIPYLWYAATSNLSAVHDWLAYRAQVFAVFAVVYAVLSAIDFEAFGRRVGLVPSVTAEESI